MRISLSLIAFLLCLVPPVSAKPPAETAFNEWLDAFNRNDRVALTEFNARRFGEPEHNIEYLLDSREETGGLDVVEIERSRPLEFVALTQERSFPVRRRITVQVEDAASGRLEHITLEPLQIPQAKALEAFDAFATQLAAADRFSGVLVIEQNGQRLYAKPFGIASREDDSPVQLDTSFLFASQGKMFTAVAALQSIAVPGSLYEASEGMGLVIDSALMRSIQDSPTVDATFSALLCQRLRMAPAPMTTANVANTHWLKPVTRVA